MFIERYSFTTLTFEKLLLGISAASMRHVSGNEGPATLGTNPERSRRYRRSIRHVTDDTSGPNYLASPFVSSRIAFKL
jgi:hypothetical protein